MNRRQFVSRLTGAAGVLALASRSAAAQEPDPAVKQVLVMFKCHLDVGFVDTQAAIIRKYFDQYFPQAIETAENIAAVRRRPLCLDHWIVVALRISRTSQPARPQAYRDRHRLRRHCLACSAVHLADGAIGPFRDCRRDRILEITGSSLRAENHRCEDDGCSWSFARPDRPARGARHHIPRHWRELGQYSTGRAGRFCLERS